MGGCGDPGLLREHFPPGVTILKPYFTLIGKDCIGTGGGQLFPPDAWSSIWANKRPLSYEVLLQLNCL